MPGRVAGAPRVAPCGKTLRIRAVTGTLEGVTGAADLVIWLQPVQGEPFSVRSTEFDSVEDALDRLDVALRDGLSLRFFGEGQLGQVANTPTLVNFKHIVALRVWPADAETAKKPGQYL